MAQHNSELVSRVRAIAVELGKQHKPKGERIDNAVRRLELLAEDLANGVEGESAK